MKHNIPKSIIKEAFLGIGTYMKEARNQRGLTQDQLAELLNTSKHYISGIENGKRTYSMTFFLSWCIHLKVNPYLIPKEISPITLQKLLGLHERGKEN